MTAVDLVARYDVPVPRYTSYPPVPHWHDTPTAEQWVASLGRAIGAPDASLALYVHIPFCESLCTFCGCNTVITRDHRHEDTYVDLVLSELDGYRARVPALDARPLRQLHLGGGTPTFLSPAALDRLMTGLFARLGRAADDFEGSVEVDPRVTVHGAARGDAPARLLAHLAGCSGRRSRGPETGQSRTAIRAHRGRVP